MDETDNQEEKHQIEDEEEVKCPVSKICERNKQNCNRKEATHCD
jgi:hypothetical protein